MVPGQAVLVGLRNDGRGGGKVGIISGLNGADKYYFQMSLPGAPTSALPDALKNGHTVFCSPLIENYLSFLAIGTYGGSGAADDPDIIQAIGCWCEVTLGGLLPAEVPWVQITVHCGDWRDEPYANVEGFSHTDVPSGEDPVSSQFIGSLTIGDANSYTRTEVQGGDYEIAPNLSWEPITDPSQANNIGGAVKMPHEDGPMISVTRYWGDMPGITTDFKTRVAKQICVTLGHEAENCIAFDMPEAYFDEQAGRIEFQRAQALRLVMHGDSKRETGLSTADEILQDSPFKIHFL
jgi:hypothetical protein